MRDSEKERAQQIRLVASELNLEDFVVEKDIYVTQDTCLEEFVDECLKHRRREL